MIHRMRRFLRNTRGTQAIEFVIVAPIFLILILGVVEVGRYILVQQKVSKTAYAINDIVSQFRDVDKQTVNDLFILARDTMHPFTIDGTDRVNGIIISATNNVPPPPDNNDLPPGTRITWQIANKQGMTSQIGAEGAAPNFKGVTDSGFDLDLGEGAFVVEVSYTYNPVFAPSTFMNYLTGARELNHNSIIRYRKGGLIPILSTKTEEETSSKK